MTPAFRQLMNRFYMVGQERQLAFEKQLGPGREWSLSLDDGTVSFGPEQTWRIQLIGHYTPAESISKSVDGPPAGESEDEGLWRWSWADARSVPGPLLMAGRRLRQFAKKRGCPELLEEEYPPERVDLDPRTLALVATGITEFPVFHSFPFRRGVLYAAIDVPGFELGEADPDHLVSIVEDSFDRFKLDDRTALETYFSSRGAMVSASAEGVAARWEDGRGIFASLGLDREMTGIRVIGRAGEGEKAQESASSQGSWGSRWPGSES